MVNRSNTEDSQEHKWILESQKDPEAFQHLFNKYYNPIFNYVLCRICNMSVAKDIAANTFMKALDNIQKYQWKGIPFSAWLYRIATNEINQYHRKAKRTVTLSPECIANYKVNSSSDVELLAAEEAIAKNEQCQKIYSAIASLKLKYQTVITLRYFGNFTTKEIADILETSENTVKTHIHRGIKQLKRTTMKNSEDIEKILREAKLPDRDMSQMRHEIWHHILKTRKKQRKQSFVSCVKPWILALASIVLIVICILLMILMKKS